MNRKSVIFIAIAALIVGAGVVVSMNKADDTSTMPKGTSSTASTEKTGSNAVTIAKYAFSPSPLTVKKGTSVTWTNTDTAKHNVVVDDGAPAGGPDGPLFGKGETFSFTFNTVGTYKYHCSPHPYMHGEVIVTE